MYAAAGNLIRNTRFLKGLSAADIARALDVSAAYISDVEHGRRKLTKTRTPAVEHLLELTPGTLDILYGRLPSAVDAIIAAEPSQATTLARAILDWRMVTKKR